MHFLLLGAINLIGGLLFGYGTGAIANAQDGIAATFTEAGKLTDIESGSLVGSIVLGAMIGSLVGGSIADKIGRRWSMIVLSLIAIVFPIVMAVMPNLIALIILRGVFGLSVGFVSVVAPLYVSETCEPSRRGLLGCVFQAGICLGILIAYIVGSLLQQPNMGWRITLGLAGVPGFLLMLFAIFIMRESEVWLERRRAAGTATLLPTTALLGSSDQPSGWSGLFSSFYAKSMITATALAVTLQLTGINAIVFYVPKLLQSAGFSADLAKNLPIAVGAVNLLSTFPSMVLADRLGRKPLLLTGLALMILSLGSIAAIFFALGGVITQPDPWGWVAFACILLFHVGFELSPGTIFWIIINEIFPPAVRDQASSYANGLQWAFNLVISTFFPALFAAAGGGTTFVIFGGLGVLAFLFFAIFFKETKGIKFSDNIQE